MKCASFAEYMITLRGSQKDLYFPIECLKGGAMKIAPRPPDEGNRLKALAEYSIIDSASEEIFDDFAFIASQVCKTPISLISFIDETRQWFKAKIGVPVSEVPRDITFCSHTILGSEPFIVPDSLKDDRFFATPLAMGNPPTRFYAGMPLQTPSGHSIGTLCVVDHVPRNLSLDQVQALRVLGRQVMNVIGLRSKVRKAGL